jgi:hypothetical protein
MDGSSFKKSGGVHAFSGDFLFKFSLFILLGEHTHETDGTYLWFFFSFPFTCIPSSSPCAAFVSSVLAEHSSYEKNISQHIIEIDVLIYKMSWNFGHGFLDITYVFNLLQGLGFKS